jgi:hypothetical protein
MIKNGLPLLILSLLIATATTTGIFSHTNDPDIQAQSIRHQAATYEGGGLYRYNPVYFAREGVVWDVVNLFIGLPLFVFASFLALRNSLRGRFLLGGMLAYFWYVYLGSSLLYAFNNFFLIYIAIFALCSVAFVQNITQIDIARLPAQIGARFPRRLFIAYTIAIASLLLILWVGRIVQVMQTGLFPNEYSGIHTLGSQALDLGLLVPLGIGSAVLLWKCSAWGYYLASVTVTIGFMMSIAIPSWIAVPLVQDGGTSVFEAIPLYILSIVGLGLAIIFYSRAAEPKGNPALG